MAKRRSIQAKFNQIKKDFGWLVKQGSDETFREYLKAPELEEGTTEYDLAWTAWREKLAEIEASLKHG